MSDNGEDNGVPVVAFRKAGAKKKQQAIRKRQAAKSDSGSSSPGSPDSSENIAGSSSAAKRLAKKRSKMTQSTRKQKALSEDSQSDSGDESKNQAKNKLEIDVKYSSGGLNKAGPSDMGATARTDHDTDYNQDSQAQFERIQKILAQKAKDEEEGKVSQGGEKLYQGQAMYGATLQKDTAKGNAKSGLNRLGPIRATQYMRSTVRWDYAPDICKDYKETGFCTFGDSCKFMHDRGDYKHGWELERDWEEGKLKESKEDEFLVSSEEDDKDEDSEFPFACFICRQEFKFPVSTKCGHFFCESCAVSKCKNRCAVCNQKTDGQFNVAKALMKKLKERKERQDKKPDSDMEEDEADEMPPETLMENAEASDGEVEQQQDEEEYNQGGKSDLEVEISD